MIFTLKTDPVRTDHWWLYYIEPHDLSDNEQVLLHIENGNAHGECFDSLNHAIARVEELAERWYARQW